MSQKAPKHESRFAVVVGAGRLGGPTWAYMTISSLQMAPASLAVTLVSSKSVDVQHTTAEQLTLHYKLNFFGLLILNKTCFDELADRNSTVHCKKIQGIGPRYPVQGNWTQGTLHLGNWTQFHLSQISFESIFF